MPDASSLGVAIRECRIVCPGCNRTFDLPNGATAIPTHPRAPGVDTKTVVMFEPSSEVGTIVRGGEPVVGILTAARLCKWSEALITSVDKRGEAE